MCTSQGIGEVGNIVLLVASIMHLRVVKAVLTSHSLELVLAYMLQFIRHFAKLISLEPET